MTGKKDRKKVLNHTQDPRVQADRPGAQDPGGGVERVRPVGPTHPTRRARSRTVIASSGGGTQGAPLQPRNAARDPGPRGLDQLNAQGITQRRNGV